MSAANAPAPAPSYQDEARANEPSMEEILASIRRIIADDDNQLSAPREERRRPRADMNAAPTRRAYAAPVLERREDEPPLSRVDEMPAGAIEEAAEVRLAYVDSPQEGLQESEGPSSAAVKASENESVAEQHIPVEMSDVAPARESGRPLLSAESSASVASNFRALAAGVAFSETDILDKSAQEMLRPLLQHWLDENLPGLVERLVRAEIERIVRAGSRPSAATAKPL